VGCGQMDIQRKEGRKRTTRHNRKGERKETSRKENVPGRGFEFEKDEPIRLRASAKGGPTKTDG